MQATIWAGIGEGIRGFASALVCWSGSARQEPCPQCPACVCSPTLTCPSVAYDLGSSQVHTSTGEGVALVNSAGWFLLGIALCSAACRVLLRTGTLGTPAGSPREKEEDTDE